MAVPFILYAIGVQLFRIAATQAGKKVAARLVAGGAKKVTQKVATKMGGAPTTITARNVAGILKNVRGAAGKQPKGGVVRPKAGSTKTTTKPQQGPGGVTIKPSGGKIVRPKAGSTKPPKKDPKTKPPKKDPKSPFAKETKAQTAARIKKEKIAAQRMKDNNKTNPSRDPKGKYNQRPIGGSNVPKSGGAKKGGLKSRIDAKAKRAAMGLGVAAVKADNLSQGEIEIGPRQNRKVTPKTGQGRPSAIPNNRKKTSGVRPNLDKNTNTKKDESFGAAFKRERADNKPTFSWKNPKTGKTGKYTTRLKEESIKDHKKKFGVTGKY